MHALDGWGEEYTTVLREIDAAAVAPRDEVDEDPCKRSGSGRY